MSPRKPLPTLDPSPSLDESRDHEAGFGALATDRGCLPLESIRVHARIDGLLARTEIEQTFINTTDQPVEAVYIYPLPDQAGARAFRMEVAGRVIEGKLDERGRARERYDEAIETGHRAAIAEEERPGVFTIRVGNLMPGDRAVIRLTLVGVLPFADGEATFRFPLVVAPRYVPGVPLPGPPVGDGMAGDTDAAPDASRISPPVFLDGYPNPVRLAITVDFHGLGGDPAGLDVRSSLHAVWTTTRGDGHRVELQPGGGERLDRDFILRFRLGGETIRSSLSFHPDSAEGGTFALTIVPPSIRDTAGARPRDVVFVLDRSGSMEGWKIVAGRNALEEMVATLRPADRFAVIAFNTQIETPGGLGIALAPANERNRALAAGFLAALKERGGTEMAEPLRQAAGLLQEGATGRDRVLVLVTDGQVANEDQILATIAPMMHGVRAFVLGIDRAGNEGFLNRLAVLGGQGGGCALVESRERLDEVMESIHRRIDTPLLQDLRLVPDGWEVEPDTMVPERPATLFLGAPRLLLGRYRGRPGAARLSALSAEGASWSEAVEGSVRENPAIVAAWARGQVRKLEDRYVTQPRDQQALERAIVDTSLRYGVLCRFTAFVAVDAAGVVNPGGQVQRIVQPVSPTTSSRRSVAAFSAEPDSGVLYCMNVDAASFLADESPDGRQGLMSQFMGLLGGGPSRSFAPRRSSAPRGKSSRPSTPPPAASPPPPASASAPTPTPAPPPSPGRFDRRTSPSAGAMGGSGRAFDRDQGREACLGLAMLGDLGKSPEARKRLADALRSRFARIAALGNPSMVVPYDVIVDDKGGTITLVSPWIDGRSLDQRLGQLPELTLPEITALILWLAEVLDEAHRAGLTHGNLTPNKIMLLPDGSRRLLKLGEIDAWNECQPPGTARQTMGTASFMSPEVIRGDEGPREPSDVFALGVLFYRLLADRHPFTGTSHITTMHAILQRDPTPPSRLNPAVSRELEAICLKALTKDPRARPTAGALADALRPLVSGDAPSARSRRNRFWKSP